MNITLFADGGSRGNPGPAASGVVLYDAQGAIVREIGVFLGVATNNVAEWQGLIIGLEAALALGAQRVLARLDSELVVKQMRGEYRVKHPALVPLHSRARELAKQLTEFRIEHVRRAENAVADALVNRALDARASF